MTSDTVRDHGFRHSDVQMLDLPSKGLDLFFESVDRAKQAVAVVEIYRRRRPLLPPPPKDLQENLLGGLGDSLVSAGAQPWGQEPQTIRGTFTPASGPLPRAPGLSSSKYQDSAVGLGQCG